MEQIFKCILTSIPLRKEASDTAEIVSQILYGEQVVLITHGAKDWVYVSCDWDGYKGWIDQKQVVLVPQRIDKEHQVYSYDKIVSIRANNKETGTKLIGLGSIINDLLAHNDNLEQLTYQRKKSYQELESIFKKLTEAYLHTPYLWGGRSITGIDCSGLVQVWYRFLGLSLPRDASQQCLEGELVGFLKEAELGDLAFFENDKGKIIHVGILLDNCRIIHAAGEVRIDELTMAGIIHSETGELTHRLRLIKSVLS